MSAPSGCPRCGYQNPPGYQFCTNCGAPLGPVAPRVSAAPSAPAAVLGYPPPATAASYDWVHQVDRTKTGIFLLLVGSVLSWVPYGIAILGDLLLFVGAIMVILGRKPFGPVHSRNVIISIVLFLVGILVVLVVAVIALAPILPAIVNTGGFTTPASHAAAQSAGLAGGIAAAVVIGIAEVLFTYALQAPRGRALLWAAYGANLAIAVALYLALNPVYNAVSTQTDFDSAFAQQLTLSLLTVLPAAIFATADYLAWSRITRREIPAVPVSPVPPPYEPPAAFTASPPPSQPPAPPPSGPAPPLNPP